MKLLQLNASFDKQHWSQKWNLYRVMHSIMIVVYRIGYSISYDAFELVQF